MSFTTFLIIFVLISAAALVITRMCAVFCAPLFACKLPEKLGIVDFNLNKDKSSSFCVYCASDSSLRRMLKLFPWESRGVLSFDDNEIHYEGSRYKSNLLERLGLLKKKPIHVKYCFPRQKVKISYIRPDFWRDGGLTWMRMETTQKEEFYFTTGRSRLGIDQEESDTTTGIYKLVSDI